MLTATAVKNMKYGDKPLVDKGQYRGLRVKCSKNNVKRFIYRFKCPSTHKMKETRIGHSSSMTLAEAREIFLTYKKHRLEQKNPIVEIKKVRQSHAKDLLQSEIESFTFKHLIDFYLTNYIEDGYNENGTKRVGARQLKGQKEVRRLLYGDPIKSLGKSPINEVTRQTIVNLMTSIVDKGTHAKAGAILKELNSAYEFAIGLGKLPEDFVNPAILARASLKQARVKLTANKGKRVLSNKELSKFLMWLPNSSFPEKAKQIFLLTLQTGCRTGELCQAKWSDIDFNSNTLHLAGTKTNTSRDVQLSTFALETIKSIRKDQDSIYLFTPETSTNRHLDQKKLSEYTWRLRVAEVMLDIEHWTPHDLRRTVRTGLSSIGCPSVIAEAILGHSRSGIEGTYDLYQYTSESRDWLQKWGEYLDNLSTQHEEKTSDQTKA